MATSLFAAPLGVPIFRWFDGNGAPAAFYQLQTYVGGTVSTPLATYPTYADALAGTNANANPVVLDANGAAQVWVQAAFYKMVIMLPVASGSGVVYTQDFVGVALGYPQPYPTEWVPLSVLTSSPFSFVSATSFQVSGTDVTADMHNGRRIKTQNTGGTVYSTIISSSFAATVTTVVLINDGGGVLDAGLSAVNYGINSYANPSYLQPRTMLDVNLTANATGFAAATKLAAFTVNVDKLSEWSAVNSRWVPKYGRTSGPAYLAIATFEFSDTVASVAVLAEIRQSGVALFRSTHRASSVAGNIWSVTVAGLYVPVGVASFLELYFTGTANTTVYGTIGTKLSVIAVP